MVILPQLRLAVRVTGSLAATVLPTQYSIRAERYLRGWEEHRLLRDSDVVVVSFGKSGRTWLRVLLSRYYQLRYQLPAAKLLDNDNLHRLNANVPRVLFTHDNYVADFTGSSASKSDYHGKRIVLLVRHPADTAVSQFFQWKHRMKPRKKMINGYPRSNGEVSLFDFVTGEAAGIPKVIRFMNQWARERDRFENILIVRYESLHAATAETLRQIVEFLGERPKPDELAACVSFASIENMRALERTAFFKGMGNLMMPANPANIDSYKVRRAKVGGYLDYFSDEEASLIQTMVKNGLSPVFGYSGAPADERIV